MVKSPYRTDLPHVETHFDHTTLRWSEPVIVDEPNIKVHPLACGVSYAQQCFEGLKAFRGVDGRIRLFRPKDHAARLNISAAFVSLPEVPEELFLRATRLAVLAGIDAVPEGNTQSLYVRPILSAMTPHFSPLPSDLYTLFIYTAPLAAHMGTQPLLAVIEENFDRAAPKGTGSAKLAANYGPLMPWDAAAKKSGYDTTLHLDALNREHIEEFATSGFIGVKGSLARNDVTLVVVDSNSIINSITVDTCVKIARAFGWKVEARSIHISELHYFDEVIAAGTAASLCAVREIRRESTGETFTFSDAECDSNAAGQVTNKLRNIMRSIHFGETEDLCGHMLLLSEDSPEETSLPGSTGAVARPHL